MRPSGSFDRSGWDRVRVGTILIQLFVLSLGIAFPLSVLNIRYRDIKFIWAVILQAGFFLTPIIYQLEVLPEILQKILYFSPMVQIVDISHDLVIFGKIPTLDSMITSILLTVIVFVVGYLIFVKLQARMMEEL